MSYKKGSYKEVSYKRGNSQYQSLKKARDVIIIINFYENMESSF